MNLNTSTLLEIFTKVIIIFLILPLMHGQLTKWGTIPLRIPDDLQ